MRIKLNAEVQWMFFLPGLFHLTGDEPGPVEIDESKLTPQQLLWIENAARKKVVNILDKPLAIPVKPTVIQAVDLKKSALSSREIKNEEAARALKAPASALSSLVNNSQDILLLRTMKEIELTGKHRAKVLDMLSKRIDVIQLKVSSAIGDPLDEHAQFGAGKNFDNLPNVEDTVDEEKTIIINRE